MSNFRGTGTLVRTKGMRMPLLCQTPETSFGPLPNAGVADPAPHGSRSAARARPCRPTPLLACLRSHGEATVSLPGRAREEQRTAP